MAVEFKEFALWQQDMKRSDWISRMGGGSRTFQVSIFMCRFCRVVQKSPVESGRVMVK